MASRTDPRAGRERPGARVATVLALVVLVAGGVLGTAGRAAAADDGSVRLIVDRVIGSGAGPESARVIVRSSRPLRGSLVVAIAGSDTFEEALQVELATAGERAAWLPLTDSMHGYASEIRLEEPGAEHAPVVPVDAVPASLQIGTTVAVLPSLRAAQPTGDTSALADGQGAAQLVPIEIEDLGAGPWLLDAVDVVASTGADLTELADADRVGLLTWIRQGGELLVDDDASVAGVPAGDQVTVGRGIVRRTHGTLASGTWRTVLLPHERSEATLVGVGQPDELLRRSIRPPLAGWLLGGLGLYALLAGPLVFRTFRRRQPLLVWAVAPLVGVVGGGAVLGVGALSRRHNHDRQIVVFDTGPGAPTATVDRVVTSSGSLRLRPGWNGSVAANTPFGAYGGTNGSTRFEQTTFGEPPTVRTRLLAGGAVVLGLQGPVEAASVPTTLEVDARYDGKVVTGTVRNTGARALAAVAVTSFGLRADLGALPAAGSKRFTLAIDRASFAAAVGAPSPGMASMSDVDAAIVTARRGGITESEGLVTAIGTLADPWPAPLGGPTPTVTAVTTTTPIAGLTRLVNIAPNFGLFRALVGDGPAVFRLTDGGAYTADGDQHLYANGLPSSATRAGSAILSLDLWTAARAGGLSAASGPPTTVANPRSGAPVGP